MKYLTIAALLLPATALANPTVAVRQPTQRAKFTDGFGADQSCGDVRVAFDETREVANVTLPDYHVSLPNDRERGCSVTLTVRFPTTACIMGIALGAVSGQVTLPDIVTGKFHAREYAVSPGNVMQDSPDREWNGPIDKIYTIRDAVSFRYDRPDSNNQNVNFTLQGRLQLQPSNGASGFLSNDRFVFDIRNQILCCKFNALLLLTLRP
ncbi:hypothetical protein MFIFM68171_08020 [Madurella fahalii]|uniref:DUF4360 domain-containing protein n=1 Tax=Madurella fahalii TaxID=1157608 RepID=A0ABQ0GJ72_9PEZI